MADSESTQSKSTKRSSAAKSDDVEVETQSKSGGSGGGSGGDEDAPAVDDTPTIPVSQLISEGSGLLGYPSHVVAGGLSGHADADEEMPIDVAKAEVEAWLQQPVQLDPREGEE